MIQEKDFLYRVPVKNVLIKTPMQQVRNPEILVDLEGGEFMHGNILDANSTNKLVGQSIKDAIDNSIIKGNYATKDLLEKEVDRATKKEDSLNTLIENETSARSSKDVELENSIAEEKTRAQSKEKEISDLLTIVNGSATTEGSFRKAIADVIAAAPEDLDTLKEIADKLAGNDDLHTALNQAITEKADASTLANEVSRATKKEDSLNTLIENETSARSSKDVELENSIAEEKTRAQSKEKEISDLLTIVNGSATTEGSFRKAIADVIAAAPEDLDTLKEIADKLAGNDDLHTALNQAITEKADASTLANEVSRATGVENDLRTAIGTKADATALSNYVLTTALNQQIDTLNAAISAKADITALTVLQQKVTANTTTLEDKQDKGNYIVYTDYSDSKGYVVDKSITITGSTSYGGSGTDIKVVKYDFSGIHSSTYHNCLATSDGTFKPISDFVLKTELPDISIDMLSYGVEWDITVADPTCTRIGNPLFHKSLPIQSEYKGCVVKNGKLQYYLNPNDWSKTSNGSNSNLDGTDGDVMIHTPKFYGKSGSNGNKRWVRISTVKVDASWVEIPEMFISAYHNTIYTDGEATKVASVVSTDIKYRGGGKRSAYDEYLATDQFKTDLGKPVSNINRATMRTYAAATGQELLCYEFYKWIFYWNYVIEYANFNSQKEFNSELTSDGYHQGGLGPGLTTYDWNQWNTYNGNYAITPCGYTNEFGNFSGVKAIQLQSPKKTLYANRWRGFENPFGDIWTNLEGIVIKRDTANANSNVYTTTDVLKYSDDYSLFDIAGVEVAQEGWTKTFDLGSKAEIIPSSIGGSQSTYKCDCHWCDHDYVEKRTLRVGGDANNGGPAGLGAFVSSNGVGTADTDVGFRSLVRV